MYSKYFANVDPYVYDVKVADGAAASSSAPGAFPPKDHLDLYGFMNYEVDGAMIANNQSFYAY